MPKAYRVLIQQITEFEGVMVSDKPPSVTPPVELATFIESGINVWHASTRTTLKESRELVDGPVDDGPEGF
jgi:hypothetical protein